MTKSDREKANQYFQLIHKNDRSIPYDVVKVLALERLWDNLQSQIDRLYFSPKALNKDGADLDVLASIKSLHERQKTIPLPDKVYFI